MSFKQNTLNLLFGSLNLFGVDRAYSSLKRSKSATILMYHSVSSDEDREWIDPENDIPLSVFESQMNYLKENCNVVSLEEICGSLRNGAEIQPKTVAITFDDGYRNNFLTATDVLRRHGFPATVYLATGYVNRGDPQWADELYTLFKYRTRDVLNFDDGTKFDLRRETELNDAYARTQQRLLVTNRDERRELLERIREQVEPSASGPRLSLNWQEVNDMLTRHPGITVGVHTRGHVDLSRVDLDTVRREIDACLADVSANLDLQVRHFSYPYGRWNEKVRSLVEQSGLRSAVATDDPALAVTADSDVYSLPRVEVPKNPRLFGLMVSGAYPELPQLLFRRPSALKYHDAVNPD